MLIEFNFYDGRAIFKQKGVSIFRAVFELIVVH